MPMRQIYNPTMVTRIRYGKGSILKPCSVGYKLWLQIALETPFMKASFCGTGDGAVIKQI